MTTISQDINKTMGNKTHSRKEGASAKADPKKEVPVIPDHAFKIEITG